MNWGLRCLPQHIFWVWYSHQTSHSWKQFIQRNGHVDINAWILQATCWFFPEEVITIRFPQSDFWHFVFLWERNASSKPPGTVATEATFDLTELSLHCPLFFPFRLHAAVFRRCTGTRTQGLCCCQGRGRQEEAAGGVDRGRNVGKGRELPVSPQVCIHVCIWKGEDPNLVW